jgi:hypothetical protein
VEVNRKFVNYVPRSLHANQLRGMVRISKRWAKGEDGETKTDANQRVGKEISLDQLEKTLPSFAESLLASLEQVMRFPRKGGERYPEERNQLEVGFGKANRIAEAPFVRLQSLMFATLAMRAANGQKEPPDEGTTTDIDTVAHLLPYCDAMLMDNRCRSLLLDVPKTLRPSETCKLFSLNIKEKLLAYLKSIRNSITAEHVAAIREVYGDNHLDGVPAAQ